MVESCFGNLTAEQKRGIERTKGKVKKNRYSRCESGDMVSRLMSDWRQRMSSHDN